MDNDAYNAAYAAAFAYINQDAFRHATDNEDLSTGQQQALQFEDQNSVLTQIEIERDQQRYQQVFQHMQRQLPSLSPIEIQQLFNSASTNFAEGIHLANLSLEAIAMDRIRRSLTAEQENLIRIELETQQRYLRDLYRAQQQKAKEQQQQRLQQQQPFNIQPQNHQSPQPLPQPPGSIRPLQLIQNASIQQPAAPAQLGQLFQLPNTVGHRNTAPPVQSMAQAQSPQRASIISVLALPPGTSIIKCTPGSSQTLVGSNAAATTKFVVRTNAPQATESSSTSANRAPNNVPGATMTAQDQSSQPNDLRNNPILSQANDAQKLLPGPSKSFRGIKRKFVPMRTKTQPTPPATEARIDDIATTSQQTTVKSKATTLTNQPITDLKLQEVTVTVHNVPAESQSPRTIVDVISTTISSPGNSNDVALPEIAAPIAALPESAADNNSVIDSPELTVALPEDAIAMEIEIENSNSDDDAEIIDTIDLTEEEDRIIEIFDIEIYPFDLISPVEAEPLEEPDTAISSYVDKCQRGQTEFANLFTRVNTILNELHLRYTQPRRLSDNIMNPLEEKIFNLERRRLKNPMRRIVLENIEVASTSSSSTAPTRTPPKQQLFKRIEQIDDIDPELREYPKRLRDEKTATEGIMLGPNGTTIAEKDYLQVQWDTVQSGTRGLMSIVFTIEELAMCTLTGKPSPAFHGRERPTKLQLDVKRVEDIIVTVRNKTNCKERAVRATITTKCAESAKKVKRQALVEQRMNETKKNNT